MIIIHMYIAVNRLFVEKEKKKGEEKVHVMGERGKGGKLKKRLSTESCLMMGSSPMTTDNDNHAEK